MGAFDEGIQSACYCAAILDKKVRMEVLADLVGISPTTLYEYLNHPNKQNTPVKVARIIFEKTGDVRVKKFLEPKGWTLVPSDALTKELAETLEYDFGTLYLLQSQMHAEYRKAKAPESPGGRTITAQEAIRLEEFADRLRAHESAIRAKLRTYRGTIDE